MSKIKAFAIHLGISAVILFTFLIIMRLMLYPGVYFDASGGWRVLYILILVDLVLGPVLTFIIYKPYKKGLKFDLSCIAFVQIAALVYGGSIIYQERPAFLVFAVDHFVVISANEVEQAKLSQELAAEKGIGPQVVIAKRPEGQEEKNELLFSLLAGEVDIELRPELYESISEHLDFVFSRRIPLDKLKTNEQQRKEVESFIANQDSPDLFGFFPLTGKFNTMMLVFSKDKAKPVKVFHFDPW